MSRRNRELTTSIGCINTAGLNTTLMSTVGNHCEVWRTTRVLSRDGGALVVDRVIKCPRVMCSFPEVRVLQRDYNELRARLRDIVPAAMFVYTSVDGLDNVLVIAETVQPWFNIANPTFEDDAVPLLHALPKARMQLQVFLEAARAWHDEGKLIDLYGLDNLVLDVDRNVRYIDSFSVFFYEDLLEMFDDPDPHLRNRMDISRRRLDYLEDLLRASA